MAGVVAGSINRQLALSTGGWLCLVAVKLKRTPLVISTGRPLGQRDLNLTPLARRAIT